MNRNSKGSGNISRAFSQTHRNIIWLAALTLPVVAFIMVLWYESTSHSKAVQHNNFLAIAHWFDPVFFQYNLIMASLAILILPLLVFSYIMSKVDSKERRLLGEIKEACKSEEEFSEQQGKVQSRLKTRASFGTYAGSLLLTMTIVSLGACILLLFKPAYSPNEIGVHFNIGANMLTMGPFIGLFGQDTYYIHLTRSLTAFQFGFLGAYICFIGSLARAYFTLDLTPHTLVDGSIRMIIASVLALVLSFFPGLYSAASHAGNAASTTGAMLAGQPASVEAASAPIQAQNKPSPADLQQHAIKEANFPESMGWLPILSFFFGFYPRQALSYLRRITADKTKFSHDYRELPLSSLAGISYAHETRLEREGFDNIENLSHADATDLAIRTGFGYKQLAQWIDEAWLAAHLREDYPEFVKRTGITSREELKLFFSKCDSITQAIEQLKMAGSSTAPESGMPNVPWEGKLATLKALLS